MSFLLISVANRLGCKSVNVDNILTYKKIFVLALSNCENLSGDLSAKVMGALAEDQPGFTVHCTSLPPHGAMVFERFLAESSCAHGGERCRQPDS